MSSSQETIIYIEDQLVSLKGRIRTRKMFGDYALYCDDKVVGLICDNQVFIKISPAGKELLGSSYQEGIPYPGARPYMLVGDEIIESRDQEFVRLVELTASTLPVPRLKKKKNTPGVK